jgi:hypothetical protein
MSSAGSATPAQIVAGVTAAIKGNVITSFPTLVVQLTSLGVNLAQEEAENFGTLVTNLTQDIEAGMGWQAAWAKESPAFESTAKSDALTAALAALQDVVNWFESVWQAIETAL